ncbi:MAG: hypothetical protein HYT31_02230 [Parcubacteria group bacterium]|nr:hypothetical protein [Parcubacteria group bacterium]
MCDSIKNPLREHEGSLLLMSLLVLSGIMTAASSFGIITIQNLRQSVLTDNGLRAFYAAESGIEDGLYELRKKETAVASMSASGALSNGGTWERTIDASIASLAQDLGENDTWEISLYDPDSSLSPLASTVKSLKLAWTGTGSEWVQAQITPWTTAGTLGIPSTQLFSAASNPAILNLQDASTVLYRVRLKALYDDITDMTITAYSGLNWGGSQVDIPGYITMYATGAYSRANQVVRARFPHRAPLSGQFGYVLFSEENLIK